MEISHYVYCPVRDFIYINIYIYFFDSGCVGISIAFANHITSS